MDRLTEEQNRLLDFLEVLAAGEATIQQWNAAVMCRYQNVTVERVRRDLADRGLTIGQCSAIPFPPPLQQHAAYLRERLLDEIDTNGEGA